MQYSVKKYFISITLIISSFWLLPVQSGDIEKGKTKSGICAGCHGADGISISAIIPNLAGQKEEYLINSIKAYKSGERKNGMMASVVGMVSDNDINDIAAFYSSLGKMSK